MPAKLFDLSGRTALVTGSSRGLGRAMAEGLAEAADPVETRPINGGAWAANQRSRAASPTPQRPCAGPGIPFTKAGST